MRLFDAEVGWVATETGLFWTTDAGGHWTDITPATAAHTEIATVFFLNSSEGWALLRVSDNSDKPQFALASTTSGGASWSVRPLIVPSVTDTIPLGGGGNLYFVDSTHGWLNLDVVSSSNFRRGILLATQDSGATWTPLPGGPQVCGSLAFVNKNDGWLSGGPGDQHLYVTRDGGDNWQEVSLKPPQELRGKTYPLFGQPPVFRGSKGLLPVTFHGPDSPSALVLFSTSDGGRTWRVQRVLPSKGKEEIPSALIDSTLLTTMYSQGRLTLTTLTTGRKTSKSADVRPSRGGVVELSFAAVDRGWARILNGATGTLLGTTNGGTTWADITPTRADVKRGATDLKSTDQRSVVPKLKQ